jgi:multicomponent K+:H+ antiporter subunit C
MEFLIATGIGTLFGAGVFLILRARVFAVILGLAMLSYGVNLFLLSSGRIRVGLSPIITYGTTEYPDPLPQALVLTAIVIGFAMTAFIVVLGLRTHSDLGTDHVDGVEGSRR